ncbi:MAG: hypothetical protein KAJ19_17900 [Gammaproteobacteria bacterium]|nr:hypothetical protein [Gammaproteobacteria bacterium]
MPMSFPNLQSLVNAAEVWKFRPKRKEESVDEYRTALADYVQPKDQIESGEIRYGVGWDEWTNKQTADHINRLF